MTRILLCGEVVPGSLLNSVQPGLADLCDVSVFDPARSEVSHDRWSLGAKLQRRWQLTRAPKRLVEEVNRVRPNVVLLIKGRGINADAVREIQRDGTRVACWYPDNPFWHGNDGAALSRLHACDLAITWSERQAKLLQPDSRKVAVVPFGYDRKWFPLHAPGGDRQGIAFLGTWSLRRERFLAALQGLPLIVAGTGWNNSKTVRATGPIYESGAGAILQMALIGVNLLHPQCADAHNMRTREISASGALQVTEPGLDGTPLRDGESCRWFRTPEELREVVEQSLEDAKASAALALRAQELIQGETYVERGRELAKLCEQLT